MVHWRQRHMPIRAATKGDGEMDFLWFLHDLRTPLLTYIFRFFTLFGEEVVIMCILCVLYWCVNKEFAFGVCISFFVSTLLVQGLKIAVRIDRPWILDPAFLPIGDALKTATGYSFPSGHTQSAASLYGYLGIASGKKKWMALSWLLVAMVGLSRMYLGVHTPWDVLASMVISLAVILLTLWWLRAGRSDTVLACVLGGLSVIVIVFALSLYGRGMIELHYVADACKAAGGCIGCAIGFIWARKAIPFPVKTPKLCQQVVKLLVGLAVVLALKEGVKALFGTSLVVDALRYMLIALWVLAVYPFLFTKVLGRGAGALPQTPPRT